MLSPDPESVAATLRNEPGFIWFDGDQTRIAFQPFETVTDGSWRDAAERLHAAARGREGGWIAGFVGYGGGAEVEAVPHEAPTPEGTFQWAAYPGVMAWRDGRWTVSGDAAFRAKASAALERSEPLPTPPPPPAARARTVSVDAWRAGVSAIHAWLHAGDCYQVNLTRPVWLEGVDDPWSVYRRLRTRRAAHGAYLPLRAGCTLLSNSPELLLEVRGRQLATDPIKGTRPRRADPEADAAERAALLNSAKDNAELTMIVDLLRNDLGRVAAAGSVRAGPRRVTSHATVHHTSCRIEAELSAGRTTWDALAALLPAGSVTGAPKVRACQRIAELEAVPRGAYCGTIGWASDDDASFNVAIRTAIHCGDSARFHVGGGIVLDSDADDEWRETEHKAAALAAAFGC